MAVPIIVRRYRRTSEPDPLDGFPGHRALRAELLAFARTANRRRTLRSAWTAEGEPLTDTDDLQAANEGVIAAALSLHDVAEALEPLLESERSRADLIGPATSARLAKFGEYVDLASAALPSQPAGNAPHGFEVTQ